MLEDDHLNFMRTESLPTPLEMRAAFPIKPQQQEFIKNTRQQIVKILNGLDPRLLLIVGPCSIHDLPSAKEYALCLKELSERVSDSFLLIMRVYFEKPRTIYGWKGWLYDPHLDGSYAIAEGMRLTRQLLLELAADEIPAAAEFLDPILCYYNHDLISWGCIGARTAESQIHRQMASALPMPIAFKNSTSGNVQIAINGIVSASHPHRYIGINDQGVVSAIHTSGNLHGHLVLRGGLDKSNYDTASIQAVLASLSHSHLPPRVIIDCSHDNSGNRPEKQVEVFQTVLQNRLAGEQAIRGLILESHLHAGNQLIPQNLSTLRYAVSLTDACLDWTSTKELILWGQALLSTEEKKSSLAISQPFDQPLNQPLALKPLLLNTQVLHSLPSNPVSPS